MDAEPFDDVHQGAPFQFVHGVGLIRWYWHWAEWAVGRDGGGCIGGSGKWKELGSGPTAGAGQPSCIISVFIPRYGYLFALFFILSSGPGSLIFMEGLQLSLHPLIIIFLDITCAGTMYSFRDHPVLHM